MSGAKSVLRAGAMATVPLRPSFDFAVIGTKRGGTTSLWRYLEQHPQVAPLVPVGANVKGTYYLADEWDRGERWWRSHVPSRFSRSPGTIAGEASPYYLYHPLAPLRFAALLPDAVAVAVLRDPVERAWSHYKERCANNTEPLSFPDAVRAEPRRLAGESARLLADPFARSFAHRHRSYVDQGRYAPMLERWFSAVGPDRLLVLISEELYADPQSGTDSVTDHLGIDRFVLPDVRAHNAEPSADLDPVVRRDLIELLSEDIEAVERVLGRPVPWVR